MNPLQNIPAGPFIQIQYHLSVVLVRLMFLACLLTSHRVTCPSLHKFLISDTYQTGAGMETTGQRGGHCILFHQRG